MTLTKKEVREIGTPGAYLYGLKNFNGEYEYSWGSSLEEAAGLLGWKVSDVKRGLSIERLPTAEELEKKRFALEALRKKQAEVPPEEKKRLTRLKRRIKKAKRGGKGK